MSTETIPSAYIYRCDICETPYRTRENFGSSFPPDWGLVSIAARVEKNYVKKEWLVCKSCLESIRGNISEHMMKWGKEIRV